MTEDIQSQKGILLVAQGQEVTQVMITRLRTYAKISGVQEPIKVLVSPPQEASSAFRAEN
ncbi:hypothetical protein [Desulfonatronum sp. SC1]|uniref:hypothetical protein n=1 Tax=Desulfonatronum sp. SC1 TaxID=2109626 RepID=UPI000D31A1D0|nr:hypothetical protein [Desulfonatronum sp. SC1]PTN35307.1 hypothetical protein C6366_11195 [Desulfonatronum sp. SC1]